MPSLPHRVVQLLALVLPNLLFPAVAWAQVTSDATTGTAVNGALDITGGTVAGSNLFHSFGQFSVNAGQTATFINNAAAVSNVIGRVTGPLPSLIDGELAAGGLNPNFNLYLINPNGITFGPNASLSLNGSLFASTAESVVFDNGLFSADLGASTNPLLLVDVPTGLQTGANPGNLRVQGDLFLNPGETLGLLGGNVTLDNNLVALQQGNIEIGGIGFNSQVQLTGNGRFDYGNVTRFRDLTFTNQAAVSALAGDINLAGRNILVEGGAALQVNPTGAGLDGGTLQVIATERVTLDGGAQLAPTIFIPSGLYGQNLGGAGDAGDIRVQAPEVVLSNGGVIFNSTNSVNGLGQGGNTVVNATSQVLITGESTAGSPSGIFSQALPAATAPAGDIVVNTPTLRLENGSQISASTAGTGAAGGNITARVNQLTIADGASIDAATFGPNSPGGRILITADSLNLNNDGRISADTLGAGSAGGSVQVTTATLNLESGGRITTSTEASGRGGTTTIEAAQVQLTGAGSGILSEATATATAPSGDIRLSTDDLEVTDGAQISVNDAGSGGAGNVTITAEDILMRNRSSIQGRTNASTGGNLIFNVDGNIVLRFNSLISAQSLGTGSGGNIIFDVDGFILAVLSENSDVLAGSALGLGGEITGRALGVYGFREFMGAVTPESDFTAGLDGIVNIQTQEVQPQESLEQDLARNDVAEGCGATASGDITASHQSSLTVTGRGGLPGTAAGVGAPDQLWIMPVEPIEGLPHGTTKGDAAIAPPSTAMPCQVP